MKTIRNQRGMALFTALLMSLVIMVMVTGALYFVTQSTKMTGAGKRYATADEAATGAVDVMKDAIDLVLNNGTLVGGLFNDAGGCLVSAMITNGTECTTTMDLPGNTGVFFKAEVTLERLFSRALPGGRLEFSKSAGGAPSTAIFFRISTKVTGPGNSTAENAALYRFAG